MQHKANRRGGLQHGAALSIYFHEMVFSKSEISSSVSLAPQKDFRLFLSCL